MDTSKTGFSTKCPGEETFPKQIEKFTETFSRYCLSYLKGCLVQNMQNFLKESYRNVNVALY